MQQKTLLFAVEIKYREQKSFFRNIRISEVL